MAEYPYLHQPHNHQWHLTVPVTLHLPFFGSSASINLIISFNEYKFKQNSVTEYYKTQPCSAFYHSIPHYNAIPNQAIRTTPLLLHFNPTTVQANHPLCDVVFKACRKKAGSKRNLWEKLRSLANTFVYESLDHLLRFYLNPAGFSFTDLHFVERSPL